MKDKAWNYLTAIVVLLILLNPEMWTLALFIDAVGLEVFMMLLQIQVLAIFFSFVRLGIKPILNVVRRLRTSKMGAFVCNNRYRLLAITNQATIMHLLVFSSAVGITYNII